MRRSFVIILLAIIVVSWRSQQTLGAAMCGDGTCQPGDGETIANCPSDCYCGDGECQVLEGETLDNCPSDCGDPPDQSVFLFGSMRVEMLQPTYGVDWSQNTPNPDAPPLGDCFGNCGAGCSDHLNPSCGPDNQHWTLQILDAPSSPVYFQYCDGGGAEPGNLVHYHVDGYSAPVRWTYHGWQTISCGIHDAMCPEWTFLACLVYFGCGSGWEATWSYDSYAYSGSYSNMVVDSIDYGSPSCPCDPGKGGC
jgi:hypothetical protein